jgi:hypothetical protein
MKVLFRFVILPAVIFFCFSAVQAFRVEIVSGELFIGGSAYQTPTYQNYLRFYLVGQTRAPQRNYVMDVEQLDAVYLDHPVQPEGDYEYKVGMPYHGKLFKINDELFYPVWYVGCVWKIKSTIVTPEATAASPQFLIVSAPFTLNGSSNFYGAYTTGFRIKGQGTTELKFEKIQLKYYLREARYRFADKNSFFRAAK